jgi:predicted DNA-binding transcriptional regulator AlpA
MRKTSKARKESPKQVSPLVGASTALDATTAKNHRKRRRAQRPPRELTGLADDHVLTTKELLARIPLSRVHLWRMVRDGQFVAPIQLTKAKLGWRWSSVLAWLAEREADPIRPRSYFGRPVSTDAEAAR